MTEELWSIAQMAKHFDVTLRTLRFYEQRGLLKPSRVGRDRVYDSKERTRMQVIQAATSNGFSLREIADRLTRRNGGIQAGPLFTIAEIEAQIVLLERQKAEIELSLERLHKARTSVDHAL